MLPVRGDPFARGSRGTIQQAQGLIRPNARGFFVVRSVFAIRTHVSIRFERLHERLFDEQIDGVLDEPRFGFHIKNVTERFFDQSVRSLDLTHTNGLRETVLGTRGARPNDVEIVGRICVVSVKLSDVHGVRTRPLGVVVDRNNLNVFEHPSQPLIHGTRSGEQHQRTHVCQSKHIKLQKNKTTII
jgi:hypothetical protein